MSIAPVCDSLSRLCTVTVICFCLLLLEALLLFRSLTLKTSNKRLITASQYLQLIESQNPAVPFSKTLQIQSAIECSVCLSGFEDGESVRMLKCRHTFHRDCLDKWLQECQPTCPLCRSKLLPDHVISSYRHLDESDDEMVLLLSAFRGHGFHRFF